MAAIERSAGYKPNAVSRSERILNSLVGLLLLIYGAVGLVTAHVDLNGQRVRIAELDGRPALLMASALIVGAIVLFTIVIDHYDKRNNERHYKTFRWFATRLSWCLAAAALVSHLAVEFVK